jgi:hypothetical protein
MKEESIVHQDVSIPRRDGHHRGLALVAAESQILFEGKLDTAKHANAVFALSTTSSAAMSSEVVMTDQITGKLYSIFKHRKTPNDWGGGGTPV